MRNAAQNDQNFLVNNWFKSVFASKYCRNSWLEMTVNWTYEEWLEVSNTIKWTEETDYAAQMDQAREEKAANDRQGNR